MNTKQMEYIIAIADEKNQSRAAEKLMISQPALSQQVHKVETELGEKLFERINGELILTDAGKIYVSGARSALNVYHATISDIQKIRTRKKKQLNLVYNNTLFPQISQVLPAFAKMHPEIYISTIYGSANIAKEYLESGMADIAVMSVSQLSSSTLTYRFLYTEEVQLALPPSHPLKKKLKRNGVQLESLQNEYFILNQVGSLIREKTDELFASQQFNPRSFCEIADTDAVKNMVINGKGISFLPESMHNENSYEAISLKPKIIFHGVIAISNKYIPGKAATDLIHLIQETCSR